LRFRKVNYLTITPLKSLLQWGFLFIMSKISIFKAPEKGQPHYSIQNIELIEFLNAVKYGKWKNEIEFLRTEKDDNKRKKLKERLYSVTIGGVFKERKQDQLLEHSGYIAIDIDKYNDTQSLLIDKYTFALFKSASGSGLCVVCKINKDKHKESYNWLSNYYFVNYGISVDQAPKNVASLRFVSYDPDLFINEKSLTAKTKSEKETKPKSIPIVYTDANTVTNLINQVKSNNINIAPDYDSYLKLGFSLANGFGEGGRMYFHDLCQVSEKYHSNQCDRQYDYCLKGAFKSGVSVGTFYWMLKDAGISLPKQNERAVQVASMGKKSERSVEAVAMQLIELEGIDKKEAEFIAQEVFEREDINLSKVANDPDQLIQSLVQFLNDNHSLKFNAITKKVEENATELSEQRENTIYLRARMMFNSKEVTKDLVRSIIYSDMVAEYNPITEFINKNRYRNSTGNIQKLIESIRTNTPNADIFIKKWLLSIIASYDGNAVRSVLALVGGQNTGKTEFFRRLLPAQLHSYYAESKLDSGKDDELLMCEKLIVMDDEMGGKSKQDEKRFKELTSKATFSLRAAYGRYNRDYKRLALLCGTSNDPNIINDPTGNTRILPVEVMSINHEVYNSIDKTELFMELVRSYESGEEWVLNKSEMVELDNVSKEFESIPFERELISKYFMHINNGGLTEHLTSTEIKEIIERNTQQKIMNSKRFSIELNNVLGKSFSKKRNGIVIRAYSCIRLQNESYRQDTDSQQVPF